MNMKQRLHMNSLDPRDPDHDGFEDWEEQIAKELSDELFTTGMVTHYMEDGKTREISLTDAMENIDMDELFADLFKAGNDKDKIVEAALNLRAEIRNGLEDLLEDAVIEELGYRIEEAKKNHG